MPTLRDMRRRRALSQRDLANLAGISKTTIIRLEVQNGVPIPSVKRKIAAALGVEPSEIDWPE